MKEELSLVGRTSETGNSADSRITADRFELKYVLLPGAAPGLLADVAHHLVPHLPRSDLPMAQPRPANVVEQRITSIYLDTAQRDVYKACLSGSADEKLRLKEYRYDTHADTQPVPDWLWIEVKRSRGTRTQKDRMAIPRRSLQEAATTGSLTLEAILNAARRHDPESHEFLQRLWRLQRRFRRPLQASCIVRYRRSAWQDQSGELRVTVDRDLRVAAPLSSGTQQSSDLLQALALGAPDSKSTAMLLEVKYRGTLPPWLEQRLTSLPAAHLPNQPTRPFSKFLAASEAVALLHK